MSEEAPAAAAPAATAADLMGTPPGADTPPPATPPPADTPPGDAPPAADPEWYGNLSADVGEGDSASNRDYVKAKGFKDLDGLAKAYRAAEKAIHDKGLVKVPGEGATAEELTAFNKAIGVPESAEGYKMPSVKGADGQEIKLDGERLSEIASFAHKRGIPAAALEGVLQDLADADAQRLATAESELAGAAAAHAGKWGAEKDNNLAAVDNGIKLLGLKRDETLKLRAALGPERALDLLKDLGARVREDTLVTGEKKAFLGDPKAAQAEMDEMKKDPATVDKIYIAGTAENARWKRLSGVVNAAAAQASAGA